MFSLFAAALAATVVPIGWPCQRLNWAWRNVWVTCSINLASPAAIGGTPTSSTFFVLSPAAPVNAGVGTNYYLDSTGVFAPGGPSGSAIGLTGGPNLCANMYATGGSMIRNRCRRMLDAYGNLAKLCKTPSPQYVFIPGSTALPGTPDFAPQPGHVPHWTNVLSLGFAAQNCVAIGGIGTSGPTAVAAAAFPSPGNTCPGLGGWFTVVWNACGFTNAPGVPNGAVNVPNYLSPYVVGVAQPNLNIGPTTLGAVTPTALCGAAISPGAWNVRNVGGVFKSSKCRKALDQFGRSAARCNGPVVTLRAPADNLVYLATNLAPEAPYCNQ